jgi:hypothetical protein
VSDRRNAILKQVRLPIHCHPKIAFSFLAVLVFVTSIAVAEIEPSYYKHWQQEAPEALLIKVLSVELITRYQDEEKTTVFVTIQAQVQTVWRSDSGLSPGTVISISYEHTERQGGYCGPREVPILAAHLWYPAYLTGGAQSGTYSPAARSYSFETVKWPFDVQPPF